MGQLAKMFSGLGIIVLAIGWFVISQSVFIVDERNQVIITQLGQYVRTVSEPGLNFKIPFYQQVAYMDKRILTSEAERAEYLTKDKKRLVVDSVTRWRILDPIQFFKSVRDEIGARARLDDIVFSELRRELASQDFAVIIAEKREQIMETAAERSRERAKAFGIEIIDVRIKRADLPGEVQASVFARMAAERDREAKRYRAEGAETAARITAKADRDRTVILAEAYEKSQILRGEGDGEAISIYAAALEKDPEFYSFLRRLEAYDKSFGDKSMLVLSSESEFFKFLTNRGITEAEKR